MWNEIPFNIFFHTSILDIEIAFLSETGNSIEWANTVNANKMIKSMPQTHFKFIYFRFFSICSPFTALVVLFATFLYFFFIETIFLMAIQQDFLWYFIFNNNFIFYLFAFRFTMHFCHRTLNVIWQYKSMCQMRMWIQYKKSEAHNRCLTYAH